MIVNKYQQFVGRVCNVWAVGAAVFLLLMLIMNFADIMGTKFFNLPVYGCLEMTGLFQALVAPLGGATTQILRMHIRVEIFTMRLPESTKVVIDRIVSLFMLCILILLMWQAAELAMEWQRVGHILAHSLPLPVHPFVWATTFALIPFCLVVVLDFLNPLRGEVIK